MAEAVVPTKIHVREVLLFCFHLKKKAAGSHRMLCEVYGKNGAPSISTCEFWFRRFKSGNFDIEDKERPGPAKKFEDSELLALVADDPSKTEGEYAELLGVSQQAVSLRFKAMGMIQKLENRRSEDPKSTNTDETSSNRVLLKRKHVNITKEKVTRVKLHSENFNK